MIRYLLNWLFGNPKEPPKFEPFTIPPPAYDDDVQGIIMNECLRTGKTLFGRRNDDDSVTVSE